MSLSYDRQVPAGLRAALMPGGWAHSLVEYATSGSYAMDFQFRGYASKTPHWATLYVGTTKVLDLLYRCDASGERFKLRAHATYTSGSFGWSARWEQWREATWWAAEWDKVEAYLEKVIPGVRRGFLVEGVAQSAISRYPHPAMRVIDREAAVTFGSRAEKSRVMGACARRLLDAVGLANSKQWWNSKPKSLGGECDLLAVTGAGELMVIEVKPKGPTTAIAWSALQVAQYACLFRKWVEQSPWQAIEVLTGMLAQRIQVGLAAPTLPPTFDASIPVRAAVAIAHGCSSAALERLHEVNARLADLDLPSLEVYEAKLFGQLHPHPMW
jgi:hypothetical protein